MRSDDYKNRDKKSRVNNESWEETQMLFQDRNRQRDAERRRIEYEERRQKDQIYQEYLAMRKNPDANRSPEYDRDYRAATADRNAYSKERIKKKKPILNEEQDRYEKKEQRRSRAQNRREVEEYNIQNKAKSKSKRRKRRSEQGEGGSKKGCFIKVIAVLIILALIGCGAGFMYANSLMNKVGDLEIDRANLGIDQTVAEDLSEYRNIALLGVDAREMDDYSNCRADAIIIMSIDKENDEIRQISIYRDTYLYVDETYGYNKITNVHSLAGTEATIRTINKNLDLNIEEVVIVNWKMVADTVDALGGIEIEVFDSEIAELNKITLHTQSVIGGSTDLVQEPGLQTLNGNQAVAYSRIRKDHAEGDYRRNERMKIMLSATINKAKQTNPIVLNQIANDILPQIKTNMTNKEMMKGVYSLLTDDMNGSTGWPFTVTGWTSNAWYGVPHTLSRNVTELHDQYFAQPEYLPTGTVQEISQNISYRTGLY